MRIGLPREIKDGEQRCVLTPQGAGELAQAGHDVVVAPGLGAGAGFPDGAYVQAGASLGDAWSADLILKVKELQPPEYRLPRPQQTIFGFQHFGPEPPLLEAALASGATFIAFETVGQADGLPILSPMSAIAGRLAVQVGAWCLQKQNGGAGVLLPGAAGVPPGKVVILGAGRVGSNALAVALGIGAHVVVFTRSESKWASLRKSFPGTELRTHGMAAEVASADLVIGGVLTPGQMSPKLISRNLLRAMRPGSALVDVGIDQGGIAETSRPTRHSEPVFIDEGVVHYCVPNMPAAVARTASLALERAVLPFALQLAEGRLTPALETGLQVKSGKVTHEFLARDTGRAWHPL